MKRALLLLVLTGCAPCNEQARDICLQDETYANCMKDGKDDSTMCSIAAAYLSLRPRQEIPVKCTIEYSLGSGR